MNNLRLNGLIATCEQCDMPLLRCACLGRAAETYAAPERCAGARSLHPPDGLLALGTETPYGKIGAVTHRNGERFYMCVHKDKTVSLMPAFMVEKQPIGRTEVSPPAQ